MKNSSFVILIPEQRQKLVVLLVACAFGILVGTLAAGGVSSFDYEIIQAHLREYASSSDVGIITMATVATTLMVYLKYPSLLLVLGATSFGAFIAPVICAAQCFALSFTVGCLVAGMGRTGVLLSFVLLGVRCVVLFPCLLAVAIRSMEHSLCLRNGRRYHEKRGGIPLFACVLILMTGVLLELCLIPRVLSITINHFL